MDARDIILAPVITEKSSAALSDKKYTFRVADGANKIEIAKAVEETGYRPSMQAQMEKGGRHPDGGVQDHRVLQRNVLRRSGRNPVRQCMETERRPAGRVSAKPGKPRQRLVCSLKIGE